MIDPGIPREVIGLVVGLVGLAMAGSVWLGYVIWVAYRYWRYGNLYGDRPTGPAVPD